MRIKLFYFSICLLLLTGCASNNKTESNSIDFEYFYRGFTPIVSEQEDMDFEAILGAYLIKSEADWQTFAAEFCPMAGALEMPDFNKKCLIAISDIYGSRAHENVSREIDTVRVADDEIVVTAKDSTPMSVYVINSNGVGHLFINIIVVDKADVPENIRNTFNKE